MILPDYLKKVSNPSSSARGSYSVAYDNTGADEAIKRRDEIGQLAIAKSAALYGGDISGSLGAGARIRQLRDSLASLTPTRIASESSSQSVDADGGGWEGGQHEIEGMLMPDAKMFSPPAVRQRQRLANVVDAKPKRKPGEGGAQFAIA